MRPIAFILAVILTIVLSITPEAAESYMSANTSIPDSVESASGRYEVCFKAAPLGESVLAELLREKVKRIIGRIGCGSEDAQYMIVPSLDVDRVVNSSGLVRNVTLVEGELTLKAVSICDPDVVWHSISIPLEAVLTGSNEDPAEALAKQIQVSDSRFVRFVRVARKKIADGVSSKANDAEL